MNATNELVSEAAKLGDGMVGLIVAGLALVALYLAPTVVATVRQHQHTPAIGALNLLLGWTVLGWIAALIWSLTHPTPPQTVIIHNTPGPAA